MFEARWRQNFEKNNCSRRRIKLTYQKFNSGFHFSVTKSHAWRCVTRHEIKTLVGKVLGGCFVCLAQQGLPAADKAAVGFHLSSGTELKSRGISEHLPGYVLGRSGFTRGCHRTFGLTHYSWQGHARAFKGIRGGGSSPTSKSTTNHLLIIYWPISDIYIA